MIDLIALFVGLLVVAWLTAAAMAVRSSSRIWLRHWAERRLRGGTASPVLMFLDRPQRLLDAAHCATALVLGGTGVWIGWRTGQGRGPDNTVLALVTYAALVLVLGQLVPRALARRWPSAFIPFCMPVLRAAHVVTAPLMAVGRRIAGPRIEAASPEAPYDAMNDLLREGVLEGVGKREEIAIISGVMEFGDKKVSDVMTARADVFAVSQDLDAVAVARAIAESAFSRVPVYRGSIDRIVGMYHAFDVLKGRGEELPPLRPVAYAAANTPCNELLFRMLRARLHLAVVHDQHGRTLGIVTLENLLEELVGDIRDEHDEPAGAPVTESDASQRVGGAVA